MAKRRPDHVPQRSCAVCRRTTDKRGLTRLVRTAGGLLAVDPGGRAEGRGAYVCDDPRCHEPEALAAGLSRALRGVVSADSLPGEVLHATP